MKKRKSKENRLIQYAASAFAFLAMHEANSQVVYTDLDPDYTIGGEGAEVTFDINQDGADDIKFAITSFTGTFTSYSINVTYHVHVAGASILNNNAIVGTVFSYSGYTAVNAFMLPAGEGINADDSFATGIANFGVSVEVSILGFPYYNYQGGAWLNSDMQFMGFRLGEGDTVYYGWMRLSVNDNATQLTIHDYAYQSTPNEAIFTGQYASSILDNPLLDAKIFSNGNAINVIIPAEVQGASAVLIYDLTGRLVMEQETHPGTNVIDASSLVNGNYIVNLKQDDLVVNRQVNIQS